MKTTLLILSSLHLAAAFGRTCAKDESAKFLTLLRTQTNTSTESFTIDACTKCVSELPPLYPTVNPSVPLKKKKKHSSRRRHRGQSDNADLKVAIVGDFGLGKNPKAVLQMIEKWGADLTIMTGDFDYVDHPAAFMDMVDNAVGEDFPLVAVVGNHDILKWYGKGGYRDRLLKRLDVIDGISCFGEYGVNMLCTWRGMVLSLSGVGSIGENHAEFVDLSVSNYNQAPWKICAWHKNQALYQTGDKTDETGYDIYETCRRHGAIVATSHEHSYERTHLMSNFEDTEIASKDNTLHIQPGKSFAVVSGLGGESIRKWHGGLDKNPWWAATLAANNKAEYGALLCTFNKGGDPSLAKCKFKDINGKTKDKFKIISNPGPAVEKFSASASFANQKPKLDFVEVGIAHPNDIVSYDIISKTRACALSDLKLSNTTQASWMHALRFHVPLSAYNPAKGDVIRRARFQVMGAHSQGWLGNGYVLDSFKSDVSGIRISAGNSHLSALMKRSCPSFHVDNVLESQQDEYAIAQEKSFDFLTQGMQLESVEWTHESEGWEAGEVWVSPDITSVVQKSLEGMNRDFVLVVDGSSSDASEARAVYGIHQDMGMCVSPVVVLEIERAS
ncbi:hypothetical protein CcCBS67573_g02439 [Chytriomyces confervae]|uniref:Calcineurin-like phosphoesterase domain-containing protein n=1 Tax=Chytriomyces confervae TaxID=246404 RepID=A0A507FMP1_9FUNG|nr:hypothetical protein CcCBS67573_g02439 [Chytriomyces confervae]